MGKELVVLLPAYNESENIEMLVERWVKQTPYLKDLDLHFRIFVINDGSADSTVEICRNLEHKYTNFSFINHKVNMGLGSALETGILHVINTLPECTYIVVMDCDNTHDPKFIVPMVERMQAEQMQDVVIASRYRKGSKVFGVPFYRYFLSYGARFLYTLTLGVQNVRDYTCGYRLYRVSALQRAHEAFSSTLIDEKGFSCMVELLYKMFLSGSRFTEIPFDLHYEDKLGQSKMHVTKTAVSSLSLIRKLRKIQI